MASADSTAGDENTCATMNQCTGSAINQEATTLQHRLDISTISQHIFIIKLYWYRVCSTVDVASIRQHVCWDRCMCLLSNIKGWKQPSEISNQICFRHRLLQLKMLRWCVTWWPVSHTKHYGVWLLRPFAVTVSHCGWFAPASWTICPHRIICVKYLYHRKMQYLQLKFPFWEKDKIEIESEICWSLSELGYIERKMVGPIIWKLLDYQNREVGIKSRGYTSTWSRNFSFNVDSTTASNQMTKCR